MAFQKEKECVHDNEEKIHSAAFDAGGMGGDVLLLSAAAEYPQSGKLAVFCGDGRCCTGDHLLGNRQNTAVSSPCELGKQ